MPTAPCERYDGCCTKRGMEDNRPRSENQNDEGAWAASSAWRWRGTETVEGAKACTWRRRTFELFRDIVMLMRDTGMGTKRIVNRLVENSYDAGDFGNAGRSQGCQLHSRFLAWLGCRGLSSTSLVLVPVPSRRRQLRVGTTQLQPVILIVHKLSDCVGASCAARLRRASIVRCSSLYVPNRLCNRLPQLTNDSVVRCWVSRRVVVVALGTAYLAQGERCVPSKHLPSTNGMCLSRRFAITISSVSADSCGIPALVFKDSLLSWG